MNREYIPYQQALELKQLGYDDECTMYYAPGHPDGYYLVDSTRLTNSHWMFTADDKERRKTMCTAPLYQQAFRWFREKYDIQYCIYDGGYLGKVLIKITGYKHDKIYFSSSEPMEYEEAELACLNKLIEIVKNK